MELGQYNDLRVTRHADFGLYMQDSLGETAFLPLRTVPPYEIGAKVRLFVTTDIEGNAVATQKNPKATVNTFASLTCAGTNPHGAYLDWGLDQDLFLPLFEQFTSVRRGEIVVVRIILDEKTHRVICSTKLSRFLEHDAKDLRGGQPVEVLVYGFAPGGARVIVDGKYGAMLFDDEIHDPLHVGDKRRAYVKRVREDGKLAVSLLPQGYQAALENAPAILQKLDEAGGFLAMSDASSPDEIRRVFGMSKGSFKKAIGSLYKEGLIEIEYHGIRAKH